MFSKKAMEISGGYAVKRKARIYHDCFDCGRCIEPGEEYYQLSFERYFRGYYTKQICEQCWIGRELKA